MEVSDLYNINSTQRVCINSMHATSLYNIGRITAFTVSICYRFNAIYCHHVTSWYELASIVTTIVESLLSAFSCYSLLPQELIHERNTWPIRVL